MLRAIGRFFDGITIVNLRFTIWLFHVGWLTERFSHVFREAAAHRGINWAVGIRGFWHLDRKLMAALWQTWRTRDKGLDPGSKEGWEELDEKAIANITARVGWDPFKKDSEQTEDQRKMRERALLGEPNWIDQALDPIQDFLQIWREGAIALLSFCLSGPFVRRDYWRRMRDRMAKRKQTVEHVHDKAHRLIEMLRQIPGVQVMEQEVGVGPDGQPTQESIDQALVKVAEKAGVPRPFIRELAQRQEERAKRRDPLHPKVSAEEFAKRGGAVGD